MLIWQTTILHRQINSKQGATCNKDKTQNKVSYPDISPTKQMWFCTNKKLMSITPQWKHFHVCQMFQQDWCLHWPDWSHGAHVSLLQHALVTTNPQECATSWHNTVWELNILFPSHILNSIFYLCPWDAQQFRVWNLGHNSDSWTESRMKSHLCHAFWSNWLGSQGNQLLISDNSLPPSLKLCMTSLSKRSKMTASFLHSHEDHQWSTMLVSKELSGTLHRAKPCAQLHRKEQDWFPLVTETVCLANSCLNDVNHHPDSSWITGKIVCMSCCMVNVDSGSTSNGECKLTSLVEKRRVSLVHCLCNFNSHFSMQLLLQGGSANATFSRVWSSTGKFPLSIIHD